MPAYRFGPFELRPTSRELLVEGRPASLGARAFDVLLALLERRDRLVSKDELLAIVWPGLVVEENNLQVQISALRKILGDGVIKTVSGKGYRFTAEIAGAEAPTIPGVSRPAPSIAVLPFANLSRDEENEYFSDGLAEELLNVLAKIRGLRVAARTSTFTFKGKNATVAEIGRVLNVTTVLEGSVRRSGQRIRITTQLIDAASDSHL